MPIDRHGKPFEGTADEFRKHQEKLRKQDERASKPKPIYLPFAPGTAAALQRLLDRTGFDDPRDFLAFQIHRLDALPDGPAFDAEAIRTVRVQGLERYFGQLGRPVAEGDEL